MGVLKKYLIKRSLRRGKKVTEKLRIPADEQKSVPDDAYLIVLFFNLESVWGLGHCILGLGPAQGALQTYSFYRHSSKIVAPALVASMVKPISFRRICDQGGWITHGIEGDVWNEHMTCCIALWCTREAYEGVSAHIKAIKKNPGTYRFFSRNCVHIVLQSLAAGGIHLLTQTKDDIKTIIPCRAYEQTQTETDAHEFKAGRYWFKLLPPPQNGYSTRKLIVKENV